MADLTSADVTVDLPLAGIFYPPLPMTVSMPLISFGNAALTYPATGVPLPPLGKFGMKQFIAFFAIMAAVNGLSYAYDPTYHSIRIFQGNGGTIAGATFVGDALATHVHDLRVIGGVTADEALGVLASGPTLGKLAATNRVIAGADQATKGGVVPVSAGTPAGTITGTVTIVAGPLGELGHVAVAAISLRAMVWGQ